MTMKTDIDKEQLEEMQSVDRWLAINTVFTILTGVATIIIALLTLFKK